MLGKSVSITLDLCRSQWFQMINLSTNAESSVPYLLNMSAVYSVQLASTEILAGMINSVSASTANNWLDATSDMLLLLKGGFIFIGVIVVILLLVAGVGVSHYHDLATDTIRQHDLVEKALYVKDRFLAIVSVCGIICYNFLSKMICHNFSLLFCNLFLNSA